MRSNDRSAPKSEDLKELCVATSTLSVALLKTAQQCLEQIQKILTQLTEHLKALFGEEMRIAIARRLMDIAQPIIVELKPGELKRIDEDIIIEKTEDGEIVIYAIIERE